MDTLLVGWEANDGEATGSASLSLGVIYEYFTAPQSRKRNQPRIFAPGLPRILAPGVVYAPSR